MEYVESIPISNCVDERLAKFCRPWSQHNVKVSSLECRAAKRTMTQIQLHPGQADAAFLLKLHAAATAGVVEKSSRWGRYNRLFDREDLRSILGASTEKVVQDLLVEQKFLGEREPVKDSRLFCVPTDPTEEYFQDLMRAIKKSIPKDAVDQEKMANLLFDFMVQKNPVCKVICPDWKSVRLVELILGKNVSQNGAKELVECAKKAPLDKRIQSFRNGAVIYNSKWNHPDLSLHSGFAEKLVNEVIEEYYKGLPHEPEKVKSAIACCQKIARLEVFENDFSAVTWLLQKLLLDLDEPLTVLPDPSHLYGYSIDELVNEVRLGQKVAKEIQQGQSAISMRYPFPIKSPKLPSQLKEASPDLLWRIVIDGQMQKSGPLVFDYTGEKGGESGYLAGQLEGLRLVFDTLNQSLSSDLIYKIHATCVKNVSHSASWLRFANDKLEVLLGKEKAEEMIQWLKKERILQSLHGEMQVDIFDATGLARFEDLTRSLSMQKAGLAEGLESIHLLLKQAYQFGLDYRTVDSCIPIAGTSSPKGREQIQKETVGGQFFHNWCLYENREDGVGGIWITLPSPPFSPAEKLQAACDEFEKEVKEAKQDREKQLHAIVRCAQRVEQIHPFVDGNLRTSILVLNKLLLQYGFHATLLQNPNQLDGFSVEELVEQVKAGFFDKNNLLIEP